MHFAARALKGLDSEIMCCTIREASVFVAGLRDTCVKNVVTEEHTFCIEIFLAQQQVLSL